jgi:hypothetical protein
VARRDGLLSLGARKPLCVEDPVAVRTAVRSRVSRDEVRFRKFRIKIPPYVRVSRDRAAPTAGGDRRPRRRRRGALGPTTLARISRGVPGRSSVDDVSLFEFQFETRSLELICDYYYPIGLGQPNGRSAAPARTDASSISSSIMVLGAIRAPRSAAGSRVACALACPCGCNAAPFRCC